MHHNTARRVEALSPVLEYARVLLIRDGDCVLATAGGELTAERATGCLLAPMPGDLVLASVDAGGGAFVLSVLRREKDAPGVIDYPGDMALRAQGDLRLDAGGNASVSATDTVTLAGKRGEAAFGTVSILAKTAKVRFKTLSFMAEAVEQFVTRLTQRLTNAVRLVAEHEEVQAQSARYCIEDSLTVHAKNAQHIAEEVIKIDAGQVHLG
ncbi:MAG: DUF3540 domain-containing protein [Solidesulfovibrio sp.]